MTISVQISYEDSRIRKVVRFDAATGERSHSIACSHLTLIGAGGSAYFGLGLTGSPSIGLARFELP